MEEEEYYPAMSGLYEVILADTDPKDVYKALRTITDEIKEEHEAEPFGSLAAILYEVDDLEELYTNLLESTVIRYDINGNVVCTFHWTSGVESDEHLAQYYAAKLQTYLNPEGFVTARTYRELPDGSTQFESGILLGEDLVLSMEAI